MTTRHTPGPWYCEQPSSSFSAIRGPNNELIFGIAAGSKDEKRSDGECEANARLIASAPDMAARITDLEAQRDELLMALEDALNQSILKRFGLVQGILTNSIAKARGE